MPKFRLTLALVALPVAALAMAAVDGSQTAQEKDKKKDKAPPKVYTDEDLKNAKGNVTVLTASPDPGAPAAEDAHGQAGASSEEGGGRSGSGSETGSAGLEGDTDRNEESWRTLARQRWETLRDAERSVAQIQKEIDDVTLDRTPNPPDLLDPSRLQKREALKAQLVEQLEAARQNLAMAQEALEELRRRGNQAHVPPSWLDEPRRE